MVNVAHLNCARFLHVVVRRLRLVVVSVVVLALAFSSNFVVVVEGAAFIGNTPSSSAFSFATDAARSHAVSVSSSRSNSVKLRMLSDWSSFSALDDDDDDLDYYSVDRTDYAKEEDPQELKAQVGASLDPPTIENAAEPIFVPAGSSLELSEDIVLSVLSACRQELGTLFGYSAENRGVGITGGVDYVGLDGPTVILRLKGRYWHTRPSVLTRVANYLQQRIPEIVDVIVEDPYQLTDEANEVW